MNNTDRFKLVPASYLVLIKDNKVLLSLRKNTGFFDGHYSLVFGHVEEGESFSTAMTREAKEEAGIDIKPEDFKIVHVMNRAETNNSPDFRYRADVFMVVDQIPEKIQNMEPEKCAGLEWHSLDNLPENIIPYVKKALEYINSNISYSEYGF